MNPTAEPFVGDELIRIIINTHTVDLHFQRHVIDIGGRFALSRPGHAEEHFEPAQQLGAIQTLWPLIGRLVASTHWGPDWGDTVELMFDNAALIRILPASEGFRGTIHGKFPPPGSLQVQDF